MGMTPAQQAAFLCSLRLAVRKAKWDGASTAAIAQVMADWVRMYAAENGDVLDERTAQ